MKYVAIVGALVFLLGMLTISPFLTIAAINTLFNLSIAYNIYTWLSVGWLNLTTFGGLSLAIRSLKKQLNKFYRSNKYGKSRSKEV